MFNWKKQTNKKFTIKKKIITLYIKSKKLICTVPALL